MTTQNESSRKNRAKRLYLELLERGIVRKSEEEPARLLTGSCMRAKQDTNKRPKQKKAYEDKEFGFESELDMAIYFITELTQEWEKWKVQTKLWQEAKGKRAKGLARPTIDKIVDDLGYIRGNLQTLSNKLNMEKAKKKQMKPRALIVSNSGNLSFKVYESESATARALSADKGKVKRMAKRGYKVIDKATGADTGQVAITMPVKVLEPTNSEEEYKAQCEAHGITYDTPEVRAERNKRMVASILEKHRS
ncbi:hypothetical protein ACFTQ7_04125 [Lysinibacillus sp. NPDC056959]|uniref:hypothetical protein n=1 Tax=Lysinibacillus sp. NPDC056959 TaxID=3345981 RepID=UPI00363A2D0C